MNVAPAVVLSSSHPGIGPSSSHAIAAIPAKAAGTAATFASALHEAEPKAARKPVSSKTAAGDQRGSGLPVTGNLPPPKPLPPPPEPTAPVQPTAPAQPDASQRSAASIRSIGVETTREVAGSKGAPPGLASTAKQPLDARLNIAGENGKGPEGAPDEGRAAAEIAAAAAGATDHTITKVATEALQAINPAAVIAADTAVAGALASTAAGAPGSTAANTAIGLPDAGGAPLVAGAPVAADAPVAAADPPVIASVTVVAGAPVVAGPPVLAGVTARAARGVLTAPGESILVTGSVEDKHAHMGNDLPVLPNGADNPVAGTLAQTTSASPSPTDAGATPTLQVHPNVDSNEFAQGLSDRVSYLVGNGLHGAKLQVNPPQLGPIELRIEVSGSHAQVWMTTHSALTRDALESSSPKLREMLGSQGFDQVSVDISQRSFQERSAHPTPYERTSRSERRAPAAASASITRSTSTGALGALDAYA